MQISVTAPSARRSRSGTRNRSSDDGSPAQSAAGSTPNGTTLLAVGFGSQCIHGPEVDITGDKHLNAIALVLDDGGRNRDRALEHFGHHLATALRVEHDGGAAGAAVL